MTVQNQALSSADGLLYSWVTASPDWAASSFPGPGTALHIAVAMAPVTPGSGGGVTAHSALTGLTDVAGHAWAELAQRPLASYTAASNDAAIADVRKCIITTRGSAITLRIRLQSAVAWLSETLLCGINTGAGTLTLTAEAGVTLNGSVSVPPHGWWWAKRVASNTWQCFTGGTGSGSSVAAGDGLTDTAGTFSVDAEDATILVGPSGIKRPAITGDATIAAGSNTSVIANLAWSKFATAIGNLGFTGLKSLSYAGEIDNTTATPAISWTTGDLQKLTLSANATVTFATAPAGISYVQVRAIQDATPRTITWPGSVVGSPPQPSSTAGSSTFYVFFYDGTNYHYSASGSVIVAGNGITDTSGTFSVDAADGTLVVGAPGVKRAPIIGDVLIPDGSNTAAIAADAVTTSKILNDAVTTAKIPNDAVTYPKIQNVSAASRALGRGSAGGAGDVEELAFTGGLSVSGTNITIADGALSRTKLAPETEHDNGNSTTADTIAWANGTYQKSTLTGNCTFTFTPPASGVGTIQLRLIQDGTGSRTVTWPALMIWPAGGAPTLSTVAGDQDIISIYWDGTNYYGSVQPEVPDGRVVRWDDASGTLFTSTLATAGGKIGVDPSLGLEWQGKLGVETTIAPHGDAGNTTKRRFVKFLTQPQRVSIAASASVTIMSVDCANLNGRPFVNGILKAKLHFMGQGQYTASAEWLVTVAVDGSSVASIVGTQPGSTPSLPSGSGFSWTSSAFNNSGTTFGLGVVHAAVYTTEGWGFWEIEGFEL